MLLMFNMRMWLDGGCVRWLFGNVMFVGGSLMGEFVVVVFGCNMCSKVWIICVVFVYGGLVLVVVVFLFC